MVRRILIVVCSFMIGTMPQVMAQRRMPPGTRVQEITMKAPHTIFDVLAFKGPTPDSTRIDLYIAVPYSSLEFLYSVDKYVAEYSVGLIVTDKERVLLDKYESYTTTETNIEHQVRTEHGLGRADAEQITLLLAPGGDYELRLSVRDLSSRHEFDTIIPFHARKFSATMPVVSDLMIYRERNGMRIVPSIGPDVSQLTKSLTASGEKKDVDFIAHDEETGVFAEVYNLPADSTLGVVTEIVKQNTSSSPLTEPIIVSRTTSTLRTAHSNTSGLTAPAIIPETPLFVPLQFDNLWSGYYTICTFILPSVRDTSLADSLVIGRNAIAQIERGIVVRIARGIPITERDLDQAIDQLRVIATGAEWDSLSAARTTQEKRMAIIEFWNQKDRSASHIGRVPGKENRPMDIFYARVEHANSHFTTGLQTGWKSDRGQVYIALGPPDYIDGHTNIGGDVFDSMQRPYEIWEYSALNTHYTFVDEYMLGDYRLREAFPPSGTFNW
jgi:GWxTD domain-containing protein